MALVGHAQSGFHEILMLQLHVARRERCAARGPPEPQEQPTRYCLNRANVLSKLLTSCPCSKPGRCDLDAVLSFYDVGPKTPEEHEKFLYEFSESFAGCRDGKDSERATPQEDSSPDTSSSEDSPTTSARFHAWMNGSDDE